MNAAYKYDILENHMDDDYQDDQFMEMSLSELSVYELGAVDHYVTIRRNKFGFDLEIENEEDLMRYRDKQVHPYAMESLAVFCRRFLHAYSNLLDKEIA